MMRATIGLWAVVGIGWTWVYSAQTLAPADVTVSSLEDSGSYFVYRYTVRNPVTSTGGIAELRIAVGAPEGTPGSVLPATGPFLNGPGFTSGVPVTPHVQIGPISPPHWQASLSRDAELAWYGVNGRDVDLDSVAPGDSLAGLGLRSSYLPGVREVRVTPTLQACCSEPWGTEETNPDRIHPLPEDSAVPSLTVGPRYPRTAMNLDTLVSLLGRVCTSPLWIDNVGLCDEIDDSLQVAAARVAINDHRGSAVATRGVGNLVRAGREMQSSGVAENAYWLLKVNADHVAESIEQGSAESLGKVELTLTEVADSQGYYLYSYELRNPAESSWGVATIKLDISASSGTPSNLAVTGDLYDATDRIAGEQSAAHAEVGPITPPGWTASLSRRAELWWYAPSRNRMSQDSVAPNATKSGFGIRSSYLPGITWTVAEPTRQSCCAVPDSIEGVAYYHSNSEYPARGYSVVPRYLRQEMVLDTLAALVDRVCTNPLWIDDPSLCTEMGDSLDAAAARLAIEDFEGAAAATRGVGYLGDVNRAGRGGDVDENAYWLLKINSDHVAEAMVAGPAPIASARRIASPGTAVMNSTTETDSITPRYD